MFDKKPYIKFAKIDSYVTGKILEKRQQKSQFKAKDGSDKYQTVYDLSIADTDASILLSGKEASINEGDTVTVFGSKQIDDALTNRKVGEVVTITFKGKLQKKSKGGSFQESVYEVK